MKEQESAFKKKVLKQFLSGGNLFGKDGALASLLKEFLEESLQAEMDVISVMKTKDGPRATSATGKAAKQ